MTTAIRQNYSLQGQSGHLASWQWHQSHTAKATICFLHATGFNAGTYRLFLQRFADQADIIAPDLRGHGRTSLATTGLDMTSYHLYAQDISHLLEQLPPPKGGWTLMGHSMGAATAILVASKMRTPLQRLILIEPVIMPRWISLLARSPLRHLMPRYIPIAQKAASRRDHWQSREDVEAAYQRKALFGNWEEGVLANYLDDGLYQDSTGAIRLSCQPVWEARTFTAQGHNLWPALHQLPANKIHVFLAEHGSTTPPAQRRKLHQYGITTQILPHTGHLIPQEHPDILVNMIDKIL
ncbi:MAG: alpha/beta fold hydrolase [bacterium]